MEAGTVAPAAASTGSKTIADLHGARRRAARRASRPSASSATASGRRHLRGGRPRRLGDRPRPDRPRHRARATASRSSARRGPSGRRPTSRSRAPAPSSCRSTRRTRRGVRVGGRQLGVRGDRLRGRHAGRQDRRGPRAPARARARRSSSTRTGTSATRSRSTTCASAAAAATRPSSTQRREAVTPDDTYTIIYTSGTTGPPKGCVLSHGNYRQVVNMCEEIGVLRGGATSSTSSSRSRTPTRC